MEAAEVAELCMQGRLGSPEVCKWAGRLCLRQLGRGEEARRRCLQWRLQAVSGGPEEWEGSSEGPGVGQQGTN